MCVSLSVCVSVVPGYGCTSSAVLLDQRLRRLSCRYVDVTVCFNDVVTLHEGFCASGALPKVEGVPVCASAE